MLIGCGDLFPADTLPSRIPELGGDDVVWTAPATTAPSPLPGWVKGPLPSSPMSVSPSEQFALQSRICRGVDPELNARVEARIATELATQPYPGPWTRYLVERCTKPGPQLCSWISERVASTPADQPVDPALFELWHVAGGCLDPEIWTWMPRKGGALYGVVDFLANRDAQWRPIADPSVPSLVANLLNEQGLHYEHALQVLGSVDHPEAARLLLEHRAQISDVIEADRVGVWLYRQSDPEARRAFELACVTQMTAWQCLEGLNPLDDLDATIQAENTDASAVLARFESHRSAVLDSLETCVKSGPTHALNRAGRCMRALAGAGEDARVRDALVSVETQTIDPLWDSRIGAWKRFGDHRAIGEHLKSLDLIPADFDPIDPTEPPVYVVDWFVDSNRGTVISGLDNGNALLELLGQVPELRDAVPVNRTTPGEAWSGSEPFDELLVWMDGRRYRVVAQPYGADVRQLAGMANTLAEARDLDVRFVAVAPGDLIVWGPEKGLRSLVDDGLLDVVPKVDLVEEPVVYEDGYDF